MFIHFLQTLSVVSRELLEVADRPLLLFGKPAVCYLVQQSPPLTRRHLFALFDAAVEYVASVAHCLIQDLGEPNSQGISPTAQNAQEVPCSRGQPLLDAVGVQSVGRSRGKFCFRAEGGVY